MKEVKNLLREILGELRMIHAELNALRAESAGGIVCTPAPYFTPIDNSKEVEITYEGEVTVGGY